MQPDSDMADNKAKKDEVEGFLKEFKERARFFGIVYVDGKPENVSTLAELEISGKQRDEFVLALEAEDYYQGPDKNDYPGQNDVWMFGKEIKGKEVYIKIYIGKTNLSNVCISFHIAKSKITYPLK